jgi:hypothetical protein
MAALDKSGKYYENKLRELQNKEKQLVQQHENEIAQIKERALVKQNQDQAQALSRMENGFSQAFLSVLQGHQSFASVMTSTSARIASSIIQEAIAEKNGLNSTKMDEAKAAARKMYLAGTKFL